MDALGRFRSEWFLWFAKAITTNQKMWMGVRNLTPVFLQFLTYLGVNGFISTPTLWATTRLWNLALSLVDITLGIKLVNFFMLPSFYVQNGRYSSIFYPSVVRITRDNMSKSLRTVSGTESVRIYSLIIFYLFIFGCSGSSLLHAGFS